MKDFGPKYVNDKFSKFIPISDSSVDYMTNSQRSKRYVYMVYGSAASRSVPRRKTVIKFKSRMSGGRTSAVHPRSPEAVKKRSDPKSVPVRTCGIICSFACWPRMQQLREEVFLE